MKSGLIMMLATAMVIFSCKGKNKTEAEKTSDTQQNFASDSTEISQAVKEFYTWYSTHYMKFTEYDLYNGANKKDEPPYQIDWSVVEKYQGFIRDSAPQLGETFLTNQKVLLQKADSAFKVDKDEDVPVYFDFDWYTNTQEDPAYILSEINKSRQWIITTKGDEGVAEVKGYDENGTKPAATVIRVEMKKENGKWKIAKTWSD